jgi:hypothetical protein
MWTVTRRRERDTVRVRVPESQAPFIVIDGAPYVSLLWYYGDDLEVSLDDLGRLLAGTRGSVVILRRLVGAERRMFLEYQRDIGAECHARLISKDAMRWKMARGR